LITLLPLAACGYAFILPNEQVFAELAVEDHHDNAFEQFLGKASSAKEDVLSGFKKHFDEVTEKAEQTWHSISKSAASAMDEAFGRGQELSEAFGDKIDDLSVDVEQWFQGHDEPHHGKPPHHGPPHHHKPNETVYQLIAGSKYTTKLAKLISQYDDLVEALNSTKANYTVFAPSDKAFEKIPEHAPKPSKEQLKAILSYHVVPDFYPAGRVLASHTAPTLLKGEHLSSEPEPQRITFKLGLRGLTVNFYARIFPINIFATNGVIHGLDSLIIPPPNVISIIDLFPGEFSTLELGLGKTGLLDKLNTTDHNGGTFFAPSNFLSRNSVPRSMPSCFLHTVRSISRLCWSTTLSLMLLSTPMPYIRPRLPTSRLRRSFQARVTFRSLCPRFLKIVAY